MVKVGIGLNPQLRKRDLVDAVQFVEPDRYMRVDVFSAQYLVQLQFDCVTSSVTNSALRRRGNDKPIVDFRRALFNSANNIFSGVTRQPLVDSSALNSEALKLVD